MKNQALFSSKDKSKKLKCRLLQFLFGALRVKKYIRSGPSLVLSHSSGSNEDHNLDILKIIHTVRLPLNAKVVRHLKPLIFHLPLMEK